MGEIHRKLEKIFSKKNLFLIAILMVSTSLVFLFFRKNIDSLSLFIIFTFLIDFAIGLALQITVKGKSLEKKLYESVSNFFRSWKFILAGQGIHQTLSWIFDNPVYIAVINWVGPIKGYFIMMPAALFLCLVTMLYFNRQKNDWLGTDKYAEFTGKIYSIFRKFEKKLEIKGWLIKIDSFEFNPAKIFSVFLWTVEFIVLSFWQDPFVTTMFLKRSRGKMRNRDWVIFISSGVISNGYWTLRNFALIEIFKFLWRTSLG
jgi:hypothetical protein